jgi:large subunit ribosomal protein L18
VFSSKIQIKKKARGRVRKRIRKKIQGNSEVPRVYVFKSNRYIYTQAIDDVNAKVVASASTVEKEFREKHKNTKNTEASKHLGEIIAGRLKQKKIKKIVFDRGFSPFQGRVKELAEAMRKGGLIF